MGMYLANITADSLAKVLELDVPEMYVVLAKHSVMGMDRESICDVLAIDSKDIEEVERDPVYQRVRTHIGAMYLESQSTRVFGWDGIESMSLQKLAERIEYEKDSDFLLKVAAVANKAQRRGSQDMGVLDPSKAGKTAITLTQRLVQRFQNGTQTVERELSIHDGSMQRVSFDEVDNLLAVSGRPIIPHATQISTRSGDATFDELSEEMDKRI